MTYWVPGPQHGAVVRATLRVLEGQCYAWERGPQTNADAQKEYDAAEELALAARALAQAVQAMPSEDRPTGWDEASPADDTALLGRAGTDRDELWSLLDWSLWGAGMGDVLREPMADAMCAAVTEQQRADALRVMKAWEEVLDTGRHRYEELQAEVKQLRADAERLRANHFTEAARLLESAGESDDAVNLLDSVAAGIQALAGAELDSEPARPSPQHSAVYQDASGDLWADYPTVPEGNDVLPLVWASEPARSRAELADGGTVLRVIGWRN